MQRGFRGRGLLFPAHALYQFRMSPAAPAVECTAPAKINLSLRVLGRREDGFHEIETRMVPIPAVSDRVRVEWLAGEAPGTVDLRCDTGGIPSDESNLAVRAVRVLQHACGQVFDGLRITLDKGIPSGAGLGGGSSDAAAVLMAVNGLCRLGLNRRQLAELAEGIGSDVPFFLHGCACDCSGRGEKILPLPQTEAPVLPPLLLIKPPFAVETPDAYRRWGQSREIPGVPYDPQLTQAGVLVNDLERPVFEKFPLLAELKMWLLARPEVSAALMSGSGATVFALLQDSSNSEGLDRAIRAHFGEDMWIAGCPRSST